jgi:hypothetical protein
VETNKQIQPGASSGKLILYSMAGFLFLFLGIQVVYPILTIPFLRIIVSAVASIDFIAHEFGHVIFSFLGSFIGVLGGTLAQLFIPVVCLYMSFRRRRWFNISIFTFWVGQSLIQISSYVRDSQTQVLKLFSPWSLLGGGNAIHDWHYLLDETGLLWADQFLGWSIFILGLAFLFLAAGIMFKKAVERS